jgi:hypothetical protein
MNILKFYLDEQAEAIIEEPVVYTEDCVAAGCPEDLW